MELMNGSFQIACFAGKLFATKEVLFTYHASGKIFTIFLKKM